MRRLAGGGEIYEAKGIHAKIPITKEIKINKIKTISVTLNFLI